MGQRLSTTGPLRCTIKSRKGKKSRAVLEPEAVHPQPDKSVSPAISSQPQGPYQPDSKFMNLPLDLTVRIFDFLETHDSVALSLACKGLHRHLFADARTRFDNTSGEGRRKVQTMMEKDLPHDQIYCPVCARFHSLDDDYRRAHCLGELSPFDYSFHKHAPGTPDLTLKYLDARSILNATLFQRPAAKELLKALEQKRRGGTDAGPWIQAWEPKIIGEELFLKTNTRHAKPNAIKNKDEFAYSMCAHVHIKAKFPHIWANPSYVSSIRFSYAGDRACGTCRVCFTDWDLEMEWFKDKATSAREGWRLGITSWHCLGSLRSPVDPTWADISGNYVSPDRRWIEGYSVHLIEHGWDRQIAGRIHVPDIRDPEGAGEVWSNAEG